MIKIWVDDERPAPEGYDFVAKSVCEAMMALTMAVYTQTNNERILLDLDHDAGEYRRYGGDYITILNFLEYIDQKIEGYDQILVHLHSANPVGVKNMRAVIKACPYLKEV